MCIRDRPIAQHITGKSWVNNHAHVLQATKNNCTRCIYYTLVHKDIRKYINGSSRAKLNQEDMWQIVISLPNLEQQIKIAHFMSSIDKSLSIEEKLLTALELSLIHIFLKNFYKILFKHYTRGYLLWHIRVKLN